MARKVTAVFPGPVNRSRRSDRFAYLRVSPRQREECALKREARNAPRFNSGEPDYLAHYAEGLAEGSGVVPGVLPSVGGSDGSGDGSVDGSGVGSSDG